MSRFLRFLTVGVLSLATDFGLFTVAVVVFGAWPPAAAVLAYLAAFAINFSLNRNWTFDSGTGRSAGQLVRYTLWVAVNAVAVFLGMLLLTSWGAQPIPARVFLVAVMTPVNFLVLRAWVFAGSSSPESTPETTTPSH